MRHYNIAILLASVLTPLGAMAAPPPGAPAPARPPAGSPIAPAPTANSNPSTGVPSADEAIPRADDPMLAPVLGAQREIATWDEALSLARSRSADYGTALQEVEKAEGQSRVALAGALPTLNGSAGATHQFITSGGTTTTNGGTTTTTTGGNTLQASLTLSVPILNVETWYAVGTARAQVRAVAIAVDDQRRQIVLAIVNALIAEAAAERVSEINRVGLSDSLQRLAIVVVKQEVGSGTKLDLLRAQEDVLAARNSLVKGDEALTETREALGLALGVAETVGLAGSLDIPTIETGVMRVCNPSSVADRPDVAAARARLTVAKRGVTDVDLRFLPTLTAGSSASITAADSGFSPRGSFIVQANLNWAIWDGGARYGLKRQAKASVVEGQLSLDALDRSAKIDIAQSSRNVGVSDLTSKISTATRDAAAELDQLTRTSYLEGSATSLDLITSATSLRQAEINVTVDQFNAAKARIDAALAKSTCKL